MNARGHRLSWVTIAFLTLALASWTAILWLLGLHGVLTNLLDSLWLTIPISVFGLLLCGWSPILRLTRLIVALVVSTALLLLLIVSFYGWVLVPTALLIFLACVSEVIAYSNEREHDTSTRISDSGPTASF